MRKEGFDSLLEELKKNIADNELQEGLQKNPQLILPLRVSLGLSQKQFIKQINNGLSQLSLIRYEQGKRKTMPDSKIKNIINSVNFSEIKTELAWLNHKKFLGMRLGHLTSEEAKELNKIWRMKFTKIDRERWGRKGAEITNSKQRLTDQEKTIKTVLDNFGLCYKIHEQIETAMANFNIDFVIYKENRPVSFMECTKRRHDMAILSQAYAYRSRLLKEAYPSAKTIILCDSNSPLFAKQIFEKEFDFFIENNDLEKLNLVLAQYT